MSLNSFGATLSQNELADKMSSVRFTAHQSFNGTVLNAFLRRQQLKFLNRK